MHPKERVLFRESRTLLSMDDNDVELCCLGVLLLLLFMYSSLLLLLWLLLWKDSNSGRPASPVQSELSVKKQDKNGYSPSSSPVKDATLGMTGF